MRVMNILPLGIGHIGIAFASSTSEPHPLTVSGHHILDFTAVLLVSGVALTVGVAIYFLRKNKGK